MRTASGNNAGHPKIRSDRAPLQSARNKNGAGAERLNTTSQGQRPWLQSARNKNGAGAERLNTTSQGQRPWLQSARVTWKPGTMLAPVPAVMVSCGGKDGYKPNIITLAWAGTVCSEPPMISVSIRPERYSYEIISKTGEFVVNVTTAALAKATDMCGVKSGRDVDKFAMTGLTPLPSNVVSAPAIAESPVNIECRVKSTHKLGSHVLFLAEIVSVQVSEELMDKKGKLRLEHADLLAYAHGEYYVLGRRLGFFGFSVKRK